MVFVNDKKYACETCIKGHRSSTCNHTERPLFEIKKKGRPITQCEHCRELRKTKQVHVKCVCQDREDPSTISHSIPAKKANRKGPPPSAAFPFGLQSASAPTSDSEDASYPLSRTKAVQQIGNLPYCSCNNPGGLCNCCTPRHPPRARRSATPPIPRPKVGDIRAIAHRPSSDPGDALELSQRLLPIEPETHTLIHGHVSRTTHGSVLYNPYGHAHDAHLRTHDIQSGHEAPATRGPDASNGYIYPVPPISYEQEQNFGARSEPSSAWPNSERLSEGDVNNMLSAYDQQPSEYQSDPFGALNIGSVDVDAWLREMMESNTNPSPSEPDMPNAQQPSSSIPFTNPRTDPQALPVPQALDVSHDLAQAQDPDYLRQFDLLPRLGNIDFNDNYLSGNEQDVADVNGLRSAAGMFSLQMAEAPSVQEVREYASEALSAASNPFSTSAPPPMLTIQACGIEDFQYTSSSTSAIAEPKPQQYAFDYLLDGDFVIRPPAGLPPLTRSSSIGSHSSGRSRSSMGMGHWARNGSSDCVNASKDRWHNAADNTGFQNIATASAENPWVLGAFPSAAEWPMSRAHALMRERGRAPAPATLDVTIAKDTINATDSRTMPFN
ncbi:CUP2_2 [Sanghuangporus weigelae]